VALSVDQPEQDVPRSSDAECQEQQGGRCSRVAVTLGRAATLGTGNAGVCAND